MAYDEMPRDVGITDQEAGDFTEGDFSNEASRVTLPSIIRPLNHVILKT